MKIARSQFNLIIREETQKVLIEREFKEYVEEHLAKLLTENMSQEEMEKLLAEGLKDFAKRIAMKYGVPLMAVMNILTSQAGMNQAYAATPADQPVETPTMVTPAAAEEEGAGSFWDRLGDLVKKGKEEHGEKPYHFSRSALNFPAPATSLGAPAPAAAAEKGPQTEEGWSKATKELLRKHGVAKIFINGKVIMGKFVPSKKTAKKYNIKGDIDVSSATSAAERIHLVYKHILESGK